MDREPYLLLQDARFGHVNFLRPTVPPPSADVALPAGQRRIALVTHDLDEGGVGTIARALFDALARSHEFSPSLFLLARSSSDKRSVRIFESEPLVRGLEVSGHSYGGARPFSWGVCVEIEPQRYARRLVLDNLLAGFIFSVRRWEPTVGFFSDAPAAANDDL